MRCNWVRGFVQHPKLGLTNHVLHDEDHADRWHVREVSVGRDDRRPEVTCDGDIQRVRTRHAVSNQPRLRKHSSHPYPPNLQAEQRQVKNNGRKRTERP